MKRVLSLLMAVCLLLSMALPAAAEGTGDVTPCSLNSACTLPDGHGEPCNIPETKECEEGCTLEEGHDGDCEVPKQCEEGCTLEEGHDGDCEVPKQCETGCTLTQGHDGNCQIGSDGIEIISDDGGETASKVLYIHRNGDESTEVTMTVNDPPLSGQFFYYAAGEAPTVLPDTAVISVTYNDGTTPANVNVEKKDPEETGASVYEITFNGANIYKIWFTLEGAKIGPLTVYVNSGSSGGNSDIPSGLWFAVEENGSTNYRGNIRAVKGYEKIVPIYYNGQELPSDATLTYDTAELTVTRSGSNWAITPLSTGMFYLGYGDYNLVVVAYDENTPPDEGLCFASGSGANLNFYNGTNLTVGQGHALTIFYRKQKLTDPNAAWQYDSNQVTIAYNADGENWIITPKVAAEIHLKYESGIIRIYGQQGLDLSNPPFENGLAFCWMNNGQTQWVTNPSFSGQFGATLVVVKNGQASVVTDSSKVSVEPAVGLTVTPRNGGVYELTGTKGGTYTLVYAEGNSRYTMTVRYDDGSVDLTNAPTNPGLYFVIYDNETYFVDTAGLSCPGQCFGPIVLVNNEGEARVLTGADADKLSVSPEGFSLTYANTGWRGVPSKGGHYTVTYRENGEAYSMTFNVQEKKPLYAKIEGTETWLDSLTVTEDEPTEVTFAFQNEAGSYIKVVGTVHGSNEAIGITRDMNTGIYTVLVDGYGVNANAVYSPDDTFIYMMPVISVEATRLALKKDGTETPVYNYTGEVDDEVNVQILFGQPSEGLAPCTGTLEVTDGLELVAREGNGNYTLKITAAGEQEITYTVDGKTHTIPITVHPKSTGGRLFALQGTSGSPLFTTALISGETGTLRLCYGSFGSYQVLELDDLMIDGVAVAEGTEHVDGGAVELTQSGENLVLTYKQNGQTLLQYKDGDNIVHNYVVKCYNTLTDRDFADYSNQSTHASVNLTYRGQTVTVGTAYRTDEKMVMWAGNSFNHTEEEDFDLWEEVVIGAMYAGVNNSVTEPVDAAFYNRISNMEMSFLSFTNTTDSNGGYNLTLETPTTVTWKGLTLQMQKFQGESGQHFESELLVKFDVTIDGETHRFYRTADLSYRALPSNKVDLDITNPDVLNTLLSNSYTLINYLEDNVEGFVYQGGNLTLTLPAVTYNKLIVTQLILPGSTDVMGVFTIKGSTENGQQTTVPGIYSKGFLYGVEDINFAADSNIKMSFGGERFTCGLLVNNTPTDFQPEFDFETLWKYHPDFQGLTEDAAREKFETYSPSVPTSGNSYNIGYINNCAFTGFEYAMRTDAGGFVQGSSNCTIKHCKYGVYINARGMATLHTDGRANTIWRNNKFIENWVPVRIVDLPDDLSPYYVRFIDNSFWRNHTDFWVTQRGQFYFYRNHYSGRWHDGYRHGWDFGPHDNLPHTLMTLSDTADETRAAVLSSGEETVLVTNPCRSSADSAENLWVYDSTGQNTIILQSSADSLLVDPEAISDLGDTLNIPILDDQENTVGTWTVYEGGDTQ